MPDQRLLVIFLITCIGHLAILSLAYSPQSTSSAGRHSIELRVLTSELTSSADSRQDSTSLDLQQLTALPPFVAKSSAAKASQISSQQPVTANEGLGLTHFSEYLPAQDVDFVAVPISDLGLEFSKIFPALSGLVILELWIDAQGNVKFWQLYQGQPLDPSSEALHVLQDFEFTPAMKDGKPVASRKLIEINTDAILGLR
jgi:hypothetical protein